MKVKYKKNWKILKTVIAISVKLSGVIVFEMILRSFGEFHDELGGKKANK